METKPIPGYPGYLVSSCGKQVVNERGMNLKTYVVDGTPRVSLKNAQGKRISTRLHRLVYLAWKGEPGPNTWLWHRNGDRLDCSIDNLVVMSPNSKCGLAPGPTSRQEEAVRLRNLGLSQRRIAEEMGISQPSVHELLKRYRLKSLTDTMG